jgi:hypothetical protein
MRERHLPLLGLLAPRKYMEWSPDRFLNQRLALIPLSRKGVIDVPFKELESMGILGIVVNCAVPISWEFKWKVSLHKELQSMLNHRNTDRDGG